MGILEDRDPLGQDPRGREFFGTRSLGVRIHWDRDPLEQVSLGMETLRVDPLGMGSSGKAMLSDRDPGRCR